MHALPQDVRLPICLHYLKTSYKPGCARRWFIVDFVSCLPVQYISLFMGESPPDGAGSAKLLKGLRLFRLAKLLRLGKLRDIFHRYEETMSSLAQAAKFFFYVVVILYACHLIGCLWFMIGSMSARPDDPDWPSNWITNRGIDQANIEVQYLSSVYWAMTVLTTVGFGDIGPSTPGEMVFSCVAEMAGCFMFAILMGSIAAMITGEQVLQVEVDKKMNALTEYLRTKHISVELRFKIRYFLESVFEDRAFDAKAMLELLPSEMRQDLQEEIYAQMTLQIPFMNRSVLQGDLSIVPTLSMMLTPRIEMEGNHVYEEDDVGQELYIIVDGEITLHTGDALSHQVRSHHMADRSDRYFRKLLGYHADPEKKKEIYEKMKMPDLRKLAQDAGITTERFKRTETVLEIKEELGQMDMKELRRAALDRGVPISEVYAAVEPVGQQLIDLIMTADMSQPGVTSSMQERKNKITSLRSLNFEDLEHEARRHPFIDLQQLMDAVGHGQTKTSYRIPGQPLPGRQALIDLILRYCSGEEVASAAVSTNDTVETGAKVAKPGPGLTAKKKQQERDAIILELTSRAGTIFGERELFYSRRTLADQAHETYTVEGKQYRRLPIEGRRRHHTATVTSHLKAQLMYMNWKSVTQLHKNEGFGGRKVFDWIKRVAELREHQDQHDTNTEAMKKKVALISKQDKEAQRIQSAYRKRRYARLEAAKKKQWKESYEGRALSGIQRKQMDQNELKQHLSYEINQCSVVTSWHLGNRGVTRCLLQKKSAELQQTAWYKDALKSIETNCRETWQAHKDKYNEQMRVVEDPNGTTEDKAAAKVECKQLKRMISDKWAGDEQFFDRAMQTIDKQPHRKKMHDQLRNRLEKKALVEAAHQVEIEEKQKAWELEPSGKQMMQMIERTEAIEQTLENRMRTVEETLTVIKDKLSPDGQSYNPGPLPMEKESAILEQLSDRDAVGSFALHSDTSEPDFDPQPDNRIARVGSDSDGLQQRIDTLETAVVQSVGSVQKSVLAVEERMDTVQDKLDGMHKMLQQVLGIAQELKEEEDDLRAEIKEENESIVEDRGKTSAEREKIEKVESLRAQLAMLEGKSTVGAGSQAWGEAAV